MQPCRDALDARARQLGRDRGHERVAAGAVAPAHAAQVAVELAALDEVGERELVGQRAPAVGMRGA